MRTIISTAAIAVLWSASLLAQPAAAPRPVTVATSSPGQQAAPAIPQHGYTYNPSGRRDPFVSLVRRGTESDRATPTQRVAGLPGMSSSEITLKGVLASGGGYVALIQGVDTKTYIVHPGEQLLDGTIRAISADAMVIVQQVHDPLSRPTQREVRKVLRQNEEAK